MIWCRSLKHLNLPCKRCRLWEQNLSLVSKSLLGLFGVEVHPLDKMHGIKWNSWGNNSLRNPHFQWQILSVERLGWLWSQGATLIVEEDMFWWVSCYFLGGAKVWHQGTCMYIYICLCIFQEDSNEWQLLPEQFAMFQSLKVNLFESHLEMFSYTLHTVIQGKHVKPLPFLAAQDIFATRLREKIVLLERNLSKAGCE